MLSQLFLAGVLWYDGVDYFQSANWLRWDSGHYMKIAQEGYEFFPCAGLFGYPIGATEMCGNTGWFPGYPYLISNLGWAHWKLELVAGVTSKVFFFLSLFMVLVISKLERITLRNIVFLSLGAFGFGSIYYHAIFPISSVLFFALMAFHFYLKRKYWVAGVFCFLASFFYPTGFLVSVVLMFTYLINERVAFAKRFKHSLIMPLFGFLGVMAVFLVFQLEVNDWSAFNQVQSKYGHGLHSPIKSMGKAFSQVDLTKLSINNFIELQSGLVLIGYLLLLLAFIVKKQYKNPLMLMSFIYVSLYLVFPWTVGGNLSRYRAESLLFPFVFLASGWRLKTSIAVLIVLIVVATVMSHLFFTNVLV